MKITLICLLVVYSLIGCSASSVVTKRESFLRQPITATQLFLVVNYGGGDEKSKKLVDDMKANLVGRLMASGIAKGMADAASCERRIEINLDQVECVSGLQRVLWGVMAGRNKLGGQVALIDCKTGQALLRFYAQGESASHPFSGEAGSDSAVTSFTQSIVDEIKK